MLRRYIFLPLLLVYGSLCSQVKTLEAVKISQAPKIDGSLDDIAWAGISPAMNFIQNFPSWGNPASQKTQVKIVYDNVAVYIGAYLYDDPTLIRKQITARDAEQQTDVDYFSLFFDTYNDHQNGFQFLVTSANVQTDARLGPNLGGGFGEYGDKTWDAVWESKTSIKPDGWVVEMKIPYISLRFAKKDVQNWGIQLLRFMRRNNESDFWSAVDPNVNGFVNQFGLYANLKDIQPPLRLSFSPYVSTGVRSSPQKIGYLNEWLRNGGMDVKYGINESFTLDATLIPDFGQVISDNVVNNLTPYEVRFQENRPFFTEGTELFNKAGLFYSRRVGATPGGYYTIKNLVNNDPDLEIVKNPSITQLYNAIKFSGRTEKKLGIGIFNALTVPMHAIVRNKLNNAEARYETESLTNYNIIVLDQALKGRSYVTFTNTNVLRNGEANDANVTALDFSFFDKTNTYNLKGTGRYSRIFTQNPYDGFNTTLLFSKVSGKIQYNLQGIVKSDQYDPTDLGFLMTPNEITYGGDISYNQFTPTGNFLNYSYSLTTAYRQLYDPNVINDLTISASAFWIFKNFWDVNLSLGYLPDQHDYFVLGSPFDHYARRPAYGFASLVGSTDSRKRLFFRYNFLLADFFKVPGKDYHTIELGFRYRFSNKFTLELSNRNEGETDYIVNAGKEINGDPIIGFVNFNDITSILSGIYNFTSRINLTLRTRHYWSKVIYNRFSNLDNDGNAVARMFMPNQDQNVNVFNTDAFFTWDFRLGSRLIIGYKNWLGNDEFVDGSNHRKYFPNLGQTFKLRHGNEFSARFIYFFDYNQLRKKY
jgi:Domain of unknown function (DUF5916)